MRGRRGVLLIIEEYIIFATTETALIGLQVMEYLKKSPAWWKCSCSSVVVVDDVLVAVNGDVIVVKEQIAIVR
uniref:Uncharacterized protein n=1 Tax=Mesocestoides corti TaxID=53468 RepID=A0A5K3G1P2_MESCO